MEIDPNETGMVEGDGNHVYPNAEIRAEGHQGSDGGAPLSPGGLKDYRSRVKDLAMPFRQRSCRRRDRLGVSPLERMGLSTAVPNPQFECDGDRSEAPVRIHDNWNHPWAGRPESRVSRMCPATDREKVQEGGHF
jgi:hypothetical protein